MGTQLTELLIEMREKVDSLCCIGQHEVRVELISFLVVFLELADLIQILFEHFESLETGLLQVEGLDVLSLAACNFKLVIKWLLFEGLGIAVVLLLNPEVVMNQRIYLFVFFEILKIRKTLLIEILLWRQI